MVKKGIEDAKTQSAKDTLDNSAEYQHAKWYIEATTKFLESRGCRYLIPTSSTDIQKALTEATMDNQLKQEREHLLALSGTFQREIAGLLNLFLVIAKRSLLARDELGHFIVDSYGGNDAESLVTLKEITQSTKASEHL
jgi:hypothetical protein